MTRCRIPDGSYEGAARRAPVIDRIRLLFGTVPLLEFLHASRAVDEFLLTREERVAAGADLNADAGLR